MKKIIFAVLSSLLCYVSYSQTSYADSIQKYVDEYVKDHEVVIGENKKYFSFFTPDETYRVKAKFERVKDAKWFEMQTSGKEKKLYRVYGTVSFTLDGTPVTLNLYQSQGLLQDPNYRDYLLLPFTDLTSGKESYTGGRYLDFRMNAIRNNTLWIDFNKAYNPYCAYEEDKYNCPIPPKENNIPVAIKAGEKNFGKKL
jgi:uncharacterized protein (DUF1684 family)